MGKMVVRKRWYKMKTLKEQAKYRKIMVAMLKSIGVLAVSFLGAFLFMLFLASPTYIQIIAVVSMIVFSMVSAGVAFFELFYRPEPPSVRELKKVDRRN